MIRPSLFLRPRYLRQRRGSIYLLVMGMMLLIGLIGFSGQMVARVQLRASSAANDFSVARLCARAGIEAAMFQMRTDPTWRTDLGNGTWYNNIPLGQGSYTVSAADPVSSDITIAGNHPVVLTSTGSKGNASYSIQTTVNVQAAGLDCVGVNACANSGMTLAQACVLNSNQIVASNLTGSNSVSLQSNAGCVMNAKVEAMGTCSGNTYSQKISTPVAALTMPDPVHVFDTYNANGTTIPLASLLESPNTQIVANPNFLTNISGWYVYSGSSTVAMAQNATQTQGGSDSLFMSKRASVNDVPATDLPLNPTTIRNGDTYALSVPVKLMGLGNISATIILQATGGNVSYSTTPVTVLTGGLLWNQLTANVTLRWSGALTKATLTLTTTNATSDLYISKVSVTDTSFAPYGSGGAYVLDQCLLSPAANPYGSTNSQGIYIVNCGSNNLIIQNCRIVGTLVVIFSGSATLTINGPITWEPAQTNYPALLTAAPVIINMNGSTGLSESTLGMNLNPPGTPYPYASGTSNTTVGDGYPTIINGIIYSGGNISIEASPSINGSLIAAGSINLIGAGGGNTTAASLNLTYNNAAYTNPPPGFSTGNAALTPVAGTWNRVTH